MRRFIQTWGQSPRHLPNSQSSFCNGRNRIKTSFIHSTILILVSSQLLVSHFRHHPPANMSPSLQAKAWLLWADSQSSTSQASKLRTN